MQVAGGERRRREETSAATAVASSSQEEDRDHRGHAEDHRDRAGDSVVESRSQNGGVEEKVEEPLVAAGQPVKTDVGSESQFLSTS